MNARIANHVTPAANRCGETTLADVLARESTAPGAVYWVQCSLPLADDYVAYDGTRYVLDAWVRRNIVDRDELDWLHLYRIATANAGEVGPGLDVALVFDSDALPVARAQALRRCRERHQGGAS